MFRDAAEPLRPLFRALLEIAIPMLVSAADGRSAWSDETLHKVRAIGTRIAGTSVALETIVQGVAELTSRALRIVMTDGGPDLPTTARAVSTASGKLVAELLTGTHNATEQLTRTSRAKGKSQRAHQLLVGEAIAAGEDYDLAPSYAVVALHSAVPRELSKLVAACEQAAGDRALTALSSTDGFALLPAEDETRALQLAQEIQADLAGPLWMSVSWRPKAEIVWGRREASKILSLAIAAEQQPGVYTIDDVLVEYAIAREPSVTGNLVRIITPLLEHSTLLDTLRTLIATDGNRSQAAERLIVHRSTLDYRLQRIEQVTGLRPGSVRGINILSAALTAHAMAARTEQLHSLR